MVTTPGCPLASVGEFLPTDAKSPQYVAINQHAAKGYTDRVTGRKIAVKPVLVLGDGGNVNSWGTIAYTIDEKLTPDI